MQTVNALLHLQRVCSPSYLHLLCISTLELGINCFVANDVGYNYLALERQTLARSWVMGTGQKTSCPGWWAVFELPRAKATFAQEQSGQLGSTAEWQVTAVLNSSSSWLSSVDKLSFMWFILTWFYQSSMVTPQYLAAWFSEKEIFFVLFLSFVVVLCVPLHWIRTAWLFWSLHP